MKLRRIIATATSFALLAALGLPGTAFATTKQETDTATQEEIDAALENGVAGMAAADGSSSASSDTESSTTASTASSALASSASSSSSAITTATASYKIAAVAGENRYATAVAEAELAFQSSENVIIAGGDSWPDSLAASALAGAEKCPILLTDTAALSSETKQALTDLGVKNVIIVGGTSAVSAEVENELAAYDKDGSVTRLSGNDRYATQLAIYSFGKQQDLWGNGVFVTTGTNFADALSASPIAYAKKMPVFLVNETGELTDEQASAIATGGFTQAYVLGGADTVSADTDTFLAGAVFDITTHGSTVKRLAGDNRYETSAAIATWAVDNKILSWDKTALATGTSAPDALAGSVLQGKQGSPILLVSTDNMSALDTIVLHKGAINSVRVLGGLKAVPGEVRTGLALMMGWKFTSIEGFKLYLDAGHGPNNTGNGVVDSGATGNGYEEYDLNKELVSSLIAPKLEAAGMDVFVNDDGGPYKLRQAEAVAQGCMAIVSIHFNDSESSTATGTLSLRYTAPFAEELQDRIHPFLVAGTGLFDRGEQYQEVTILRGPLPAMLCEVAFISNASDMQIYESRKDTVATYIANGILSGN